MIAATCQQQYASLKADIAIFDFYFFLLLLLFLLFYVFFVVSWYWLQMLPFDCDNNLLCACNYYYYSGIVSLFCSMFNGTHDNIHFGQSLSSSEQLQEETLWRRNALWCRQQQQEYQSEAGKEAYTHINKTKGNGINYGWQGSHITIKMICYMLLKIIIFNIDPHILRLQHSATERNERDKWCLQKTIEHTTCTRGSINLALHSDTFYTSKLYAEKKKQSRINE